MIARSSSSFFSPASMVGDGSANLRFSCRCRFPGAFMRVPRTECIQHRVIALAGIGGQSIQKIAESDQRLN